MARILVFAAAAVAALLLLWLLFWGLVHVLIIGFWVVLVVALGVLMFRVGRRSRSRARERE
jgi:fatty acid desaturase